jgi:peptidoglycan hydrolase-like protein with peptidoglycan-binding domain
METAYRKHSGTASPVILRVGARGPAVTELQTALGIETDGAFGPATLRAVQDFQRGEGLTADGVVGHLTWDRLRAAADATPPSQPDQTDAMAALTEKATGLGAAATGVAAAGGAIRELFPADVWQFALYGAVALGLAYAGVMLFRKVRA